MKIVILGGADFNATRFCKSERTELETFIRRADELKLEAPGYRKIYAFLKKK